MIEARAYVIHLARAEGRRAQAERLVGMVPLRAEIVEAVDGLALDDQAVAAVYRPNMHRPRYPFRLRKQEIGCFLSYRKVWEMIAEGPDAAGLIVEDDVDFDMLALRPVLELALNAMHPVDYVRFPYRSHGESGRVVVAAGGVTLTEPKVVGLGMQMQLVGREAAERLLAVTRQFDRPVDTLLQMRWLTGIRMVTARPVVIREIGGMLGGTLVQRKDKPLAEVLRRELDRAVYRLCLRLASARNG